MSIVRKRRGADELWKSHVLAKLKEPHCWICAQAINEVERDFFWFTSEQYYEPEIVDKMRLVHGFCPTHTRHFLQTGANSVITTVYRYLAWYMIEQLNAARDVLLKKSAKRNGRERCRQAAALLRRQGVCPMCASLQCGEQINVHALNCTLMLREVRNAYEKSSGLCLPHFCQVASVAAWDEVGFLGADMQRRLSAKAVSEGSAGALLEQAVGLDREISLRRSALRDSLISQDNCGPGTCIDLGNPAPLWSPTFVQLLNELKEPGCLVCSACNRGVRQYLDWLARQMTQPPASLSWESTFHVCAAHLWALYAAGYDQAAILIGKRMIQEGLARLNTLASGLKSRPAENLLMRFRQGFLVWCGVNGAGFVEESDRPQSRWGKVEAVLEAPQKRLDKLRTIAFRRDLCQACAHIQTTAGKRLELILRALEDPVGRKAYHTGSGVCLRHCIEAANLAEVPAALAELLSAQIARLRLLEWELEEASRKVSWSVRYEAKGPESEAWRRAAYQFCGV